MSVLLIAEHNKELRPFTLNAVTAASQIDGDVHAVIIGQNCDAAKSLSELPLIKSYSRRCIITKILLLKILHL